MQIFMTEEDGSVCAFEVKSVTLYPHGEVSLALDNGTDLKLSKDSLCDKLFLFRMRLSNEPYVDYGFDMITKFIDEFVVKFRPSVSD